MTDIDLAADEQSLKAFLGAKANEGKPVRTRLRASERVIARVTDGIYREPASALRELISNAWDADAHNVTILTDAPRFGTIYVRDDGRGMSFETLSRLVHNIGGSAKRNAEGAELGITDAADFGKTKLLGRPIIGKIGIGLFSVSQIARRFRIITKVEGADYRLVAEVQLRQHTEEDDPGTRDDDDSFLTGDVYIVREPTDDLKAHGTDIILEDIKPGVRDILRDDERWRMHERHQQLVRQGDTEAAREFAVKVPSWHSGWIAGNPVKADTTTVLAIEPKYPWKDDTPPEERMERLMWGVEQLFSKFDRPDLEATFDYYLGMVWSLGLSAPVPYIEKHPFDLTRDDNIRLFWSSGNAKDVSASEIELAPGQKVRDAIQADAPGHPILQSGLDRPQDRFRVVIDGIELRRPVSFKFRKSSDRGLEQSILLVSRYAPNLSVVPVGQRGGELEVEGYLFWTGRIIPKENNGVLVRIRGASGDLFDPTFFAYPVAEATRLKQITSELFVREGLDAALNIDRESFNFAHPHFQLTSNWLHRSLRQLITRQKDLASRLRDRRSQGAAAQAKNAISSVAQDVWQARRGEDPPEVLFTETRPVAEQARQQGTPAFSRTAVPALRDVSGSERTTRDAKAAALVQILTAYDLLDGLGYDEQEALISAILQVFLEAK